MILVVRVPAWELEENGRTLTVGDVVESWRTFDECAETSPAGDVQTI